MSKSTKDVKQQVPLPVVLGICVVALIAIGFIGFRTLSGPSYTKVPTAADQHSQAEKLALKSGGDFTKLSPQEQQLLNNMTLGHGQKFVEINYPRLSGQGGK